MNQGDKLKVNPNTGEVEMPTQEEEFSSIFEENGTFCRVGSIAGGILEIDLQSTKQKGKEQRCISFMVTNVDPQTQELVSHEMNFMDEATFNKCKEFINKLNWND